MNRPINEVTNEVRYVVKVHGNEVSPRYSTPQAADAALQMLSEVHQAIAEIVPVTSDGKQMLLE